MANKASLNVAEGVETIAGHVEKIRVDPAAHTLTVDLDNGVESPYDIVIDATGFDSGWFLDAMDVEARQALDRALHGEEAGRLPITTEKIKGAIDANLAIEGLEPPLHLPMLADLAQGPGFPNLSCLGLTSDRVLQRHCAIPAESPSRETSL
jgi:mycobactin lysine-N-oxygenase